MTDLNIGGIVKRTKIYGPGWRSAVWLQGCTLACKGCWNKELWPTKGGTFYTHEELLSELLSATDCEGVTFLGGEPLQQAEALLPLLKDLRAIGKSIFIYSGYNRDELDETQLACVEQADIVVLGRYIQELRNTNLRWRGSENQVVEFLTDRYSTEDMNGEASEYEVHIHPDGTTTVLGYPPTDPQTLYS
jgi:anaerobic ribonucleoside-triphosphate reductase activating protein